ncbi:hypothetical protein pb186bvf_018282 [Paramecium bursaria]
MQYLSIFDNFGTSIQLRGHKGQTQQKTIIGGLTTIIVYTLSFSYFIYILVLWQTGDIGPSIAKYNDIQNFSIYTSGEQSLFDFTFVLQEQSIDPFDQKNIILLPLLIYQIKGRQQEPINMLKNMKVSQFNSAQIQTKNLNLILSNNVEGYKQQDAMIILVDCQDKYLLVNQSCATQDLVNKFKQQANYIMYQNSIQSYNTRLKQIQTVPRKQYLAFEYTSCYNLYMQIKTANLNVEDGLLFQNLKSYKYVDDISFISQVSSQEFNLKSFGYNYYFSFLIRLSPLVYQVDVRYQNLGEIFAMVGSIASVLMSIGILIEFVNGYYQDNILIYKILQQYFPNKILINEIGQIVNIKGLQDKSQIQKLSELAETKLNILNIIYQISRMEMFLLYKFGRNELIKANLFTVQTDQFEESQEMVTLDEKRFYIEDMELFQNQMQIFYSWGQKQQEQQESIHPIQEFSYIRIHNKINIYLIMRNYNQLIKFYNLITQLSLFYSINQQLDLQSFINQIQIYKLNIYMIKKSISKKVRQCSFLVKTKQILDSSSYGSIIEWINDGSGFIIYDQKQFCDIVLPQFFKHTNYQSFLRSINNYGFKRVNINKNAIFTNPQFKPELPIEKLSYQEVRQIKQSQRDEFIMSNHNLKTELMAIQLTQAKQREQIIYLQKQLIGTIKTIQLLNHLLMKCYHRAKHQMGCSFNILMTLVHAVNPGPFKEIFREMFQNVERIYLRQLSLNNFNTLDNSLEQDSNHSYNSYQYLYINSSTD